MIKIFWEWITVMVLILCILRPKQTKIGFNGNRGDS